MIPAFGYLRVSGLSQAGEEKDGLPRQRRAIELFATANGYEIVRWYEEPYTGKELDRPVLRQLIADLNGVTTVIIEQLDRLARKMTVQEMIVEDFQKRKITLISTKEPNLDSEDETRVLIRQVMGAVAQYERAKLFNRMQAGKQRAKANGQRYGGRFAFGRHPDYPTEIYVLQRILIWKQEGCSLTRIADRLNANGHSTREGKRWHPMTVKRILARNQADQVPALTHT